GGQGVGEHDGVLVVEPVRDLRGADVGEWHAYVFGLAAVIPAAGVGVAVDAADGGGVGIDVVAVGVQAAGAEVARAAVDVERHHHPVTGGEVLHRRADLVDHADELVPEGGAHPGVGH